MLVRKFILIFVIFSLTIFSIESLAHGGRLNASGCHNDRKNGGYHCHRNRASSKNDSRYNLTPPKGNAEAKWVFKNCAEARAAGAAPVYASDPRYGKHLDRDGDGIGCE